MSSSLMDSLIEKTNRLHTSPWKVLLAFIVVTFLALTSAGKLQINATPYMIGHDHPSRMADHKSKKTFTGTGEQAFIAVVNQQGDVFNNETLNLVKILSDKFEKMSLVSDIDKQFLASLSGLTNDQSKKIEAILDKGVLKQDVYVLEGLKNELVNSNVLTQSEIITFETLLVRLNPVKKVRSLTTMENITPTVDGIDIHPLMGRKSKDPTAAELKKEVFENPLYIDGLIAQDSKATSIQVEFYIAEDDSPSMLLAFQAINNIVSQTDLGANSVHLSGPPMIASETASNMEKDNQTLLPGVLLVILFVLLISFGRIQGMVIPMLIAIISLIWTLAVMSALGVKQNIITSMLPVFIIAIAVCDAIHFLSDYYRHLPENADRAQRSIAASAAVKQLFFPMLITTITTALGFVSLAWTEVTFIQEFGVFVGIGVILAWIITIFFLPTMLVLWKAQPPKWGLLASTNIDGGFSAFAAISKYAKPAIATTVILIGVCGLIISQQLKVDNQVIGYFEETSQIRIDDKVLNEHFGGTTPISVMVQSDQVDAFKQADYVLALEKIENRLKSHDLVGYTYGLPDFVKRLNQALNNDMTAQAYSLPNSLSTELLSQYYLLYENGNGRDLFDVVDRRYQNSRVLAILHSDKSSEVSTIINDIMTYSASVLPAGSKISISGYGEILVATTDAVVWGQVASLILASILITILVMLIFRSASIGMVVPLPLILTLLGVFVIMALTGTNLDIGTSIIAAISFGIGIDYSIHIISALKSSQAQTRLARIEEALAKCAKPILINTLALGLGFLVLTMSGYQALVNLGYFISITMFLSAIFSLLVLPSVVVSVIHKDEEALEHVGSEANA
ncbi:efflux RND transporter permease subunit [Pseudomonas sp. HK3]|jgi:predicted RND superfamily exporter protein